MKKTKPLSIASILLAGSVICLYLASVFSVMSLTLIALASIITYIAILECRMSYALVMYVASCILGFLIVPDKSAVILYGLLFGIYPFIKHLSEKIRLKPISWSVKILCVNALLFILYFAFKELLLSFVPDDFLVIFAYVAFNFVFITFDLCITKLTPFYMWRVHRHIV